jgi:predicted nucleic acid-binding protein
MPRPGLPVPGKKATAVKLSDALQGVQRLFLDTAPVIYYVETNARHLPSLDIIFDAVDARQLQVVTSPITLAECLVLPYRQKNPPVARLFAQLIFEKSQFVTIGQSVAQMAAQLRADYNLNLPDALQLATAQASQCDAFLTNDLVLRRVTALRVLVLDEIEPPAQHPK